MLTQLGLIGIGILNRSGTHIILNINTCALFYKMRVNTGVIQQEEGSFLQQIGVKFKKKTGKVLYLEYSFVWC
jgi:hypothetical protein